MEKVGRVLIVVGEGRWGTLRFSFMLTPSLYKVLIITNTNVMVHMVVLELCVVDRIRNIFEIILLD